MTTMDSDSESQDSDDGRRFRFETTRKDATLISRSANRDSPYSSRAEQRSRSPGRSDRNRKDPGRDFRSRYDSRHDSRDRDSKDRRDRYSYEKYLKDSKDAHDSKHLKQRNDRESKGSPSQKERDDRETRDSKDFKDSKDRRDSRGSRSHDKDSKSLRESRSSRDKSRKGSRDRSRSDRSTSDKHKFKSHEKHKSHSKDNSSKFKESRAVEKNEKYPNASLEVRQIESKLPKEVAGSTKDGFREFNISDFEIVSDLEEFSSTSSSSSHGHGSKVRKRHSKQKSSRLSDRHSERKGSQTEDLRKVNPRNGNNSTISSNNNSTTLSDFSLDSALPTTSVNKKLEDCEKVTTDKKMETDFSSSQYLSESSQGEKAKIYGPTLPQQLDKIANFRSDDDDNDGTEAESSSLMMKNANRKYETNSIGPMLPCLSSKSTESAEEEVNRSRKNCVVKTNVKNESMSEKLQDGKLLKESSRAKIIGPSLPAHLVTSKSESDEDTCGPILPPHLVEKVKNNTELKMIGPCLPSEFKSDDIKSDESDEDDEIIGPLPADDPANNFSIVQRSLEIRARRIQNEFMTEVDNKQKKREEWMTELPSVKSASLGLGPRKFKMRDGPDLSDRSSWTDTPEDTLRKKQEKAEERLAAISTDKKIIKNSSFPKEETSERGKKRQKSLLEIHQKKLKKKKKKEEKEAREKGKSTRRPFDRDVDLQANRFDDAQKKHVFMKAQLLDDRFTQGKY